MSTDVEHLWQQVYNLTQGPGRVIGHGSHVVLPHNFDQGMLNRITKLKDASAADADALIGAIRGDIKIAATVGMIGSEYEEELQKLLDKIWEDAQNG